MINRASVQLWGHSETIGRPAKIGREKKGFRILCTILSPILRHGSDFIYTKNSGGAMLMKMAVFLKKTELIYEKIFRAARAHMLRIFLRNGGRSCRKKQFYNSKMHVALTIFLRKLN